MENKHNSEPVTQNEWSKISYSPEANFEISTSGDYSPQAIKLTERARDLYCARHGVSDDVIRGFRENILPMVEAKDEEVTTLLIENNSWGMNPGDFGISDFVVHSLVSRVNPVNMHELMMAERLIPTGDYNRFEQNRRDASALQGTLWRGRDFIHDERPGLHELFTAMVEMYDAKDDFEKFEKKKAALEDIIKIRLDEKNGYHYSGFKGDICLNLKNYDKMVTKTTDAWNDRQGRVRYNEKAIDILRRMVKNTSALLVEKPTTDDAELNELLGRINPRISERDGTVFVDFRRASKLVEKMNKILIEKQNTLGLRPSMAQALSYTERMATYAMRGLDNRDFKNLALDPGFEEMVRFVELTSSAKPYSKTEFEQFYEGFRTKFSKNLKEYGEAGYSKIVMHVIDNVEDLSNKYKKENKPPYIIDSIWSGNLTSELMKLPE